MTRIHEEVNWFPYNHVCLNCNEGLYKDAIRIGYEKGSDGWTSYYVCATCGQYITVNWGDHMGGQGDYVKLVDEFPGICVTDMNYIAKHCTLDEVIKKTNVIEQLLTKGVEFEYTIKD